jgi:glycerophosphoryl diester phosphodiesterase
VVLMHDDTLERTTDGQGPVAAAPAAALAALDAGSWFGPAWRGTRVPTLAETLRLLAELDLYPNIEIKPCPGREVATAHAVVAVVRQAWPADRPAPLLSSFAPASLAAAKEAGPELPRGLLLEGMPADWGQRAAALGCASINCAAEDLTAAWAAAIRQAGYALAVYTVNDPADARRLLSWGADAVITDRPGALLAAL